jgi:hypothetical protein
MESQVPSWKYNELKQQNPGWGQNQIESTIRNRAGTTQSTASLGGPIMQYGYQNKNGPYGMGGGAGGAGSGSGSSGPTNAASAWYNGVLSGTNLPYSPFAKANLESKATGMNAAAETARNETMVGNAAANGASASDPSMAGAKLNSMARRQSDNANSVQDIESQANQANFAAQANAAAHLSQTQLAYDEMANGNAMRYSPFAGGYGGGSSGRTQGGGGGFAYLPTGTQPPYGGDIAVKAGGKGRGQSNGFRAPPPGAPMRTAGGAPINY